MHACVRACVCACVCPRARARAHTHTHTQEKALLQQEMGAVEKLMQEEVDRLQDALQKSQHHLAVYILSLSLSLSHTHTHTNTNTNSHMYAHTFSLSLSLSLSLTHTHTQEQERSLSSVSQQAEGLKRQRDVLQLELDALERESIHLRSALAQKSAEFEMQRCIFF
jgi:hypothetical protein